MSSTVSSVMTALLSTIATAVGTGWQELVHVQDLSKLNERTAKKGYGMRPMDATAVETPIRSYTLDHAFEIVLTDTLARVENDEEYRAVLATLYDKADEVFKRIILTKLGLPSLVVNVTGPSISQPEIGPKKIFIALRMRVLVKHRSAITT